MELPITYCDIAKFAPGHASSYLDKFGHLLTWNVDEKEVIADIGCANGEITIDILLPFCGDKVDEIIGIDISSDMLQLANARNKTTKVSFVQIDVAKKTIDVNTLEKFHHVFSFSCVHMIPNQRQLAENLYKMLKPGGEAFVSFYVRNMIMQTWFNICEYPKWSKYLGDFPKKFSNYQISAHPQDDFETLFRKVGFTVESYVEHKKIVFTDRLQFESLVIQGNLLTPSIPESLRGDFLKDQVALANTCCKNGNSYEVPMEVLVGIIRKPSN